MESLIRSCDRSSSENSAIYSSICLERATLKFRWQTRCRLDSACPCAVGRHSQAKRSSVVRIAGGSSSPVLTVPSPEDSGVYERRLNQAALRSLGPAPDVREF